MSTENHEGGKDDVMLVHMVNRINAAYPSESGQCFQADSIADLQRYGLDGSILGLLEDLRKEGFAESDLAAGVIEWLLNDRTHRDQFEPGAKQACQLFIEQSDTPFEVRFEIGQRIRHRSGSWLSSGLETFLVRPKEGGGRHD